MGWEASVETSDGGTVWAVGHEGWAGALFADGAVGSGFGPGGISVTMRPDGTDLAYDGWQARPDSDVVGWVGACQCGWRGQP